MLWRRHQPQAQAARQAERRQEADAAIRRGRNSAIRLYRCLENGRRGLETQADNGEGAMRTMILVGGFLALAAGAQAGTVMTLDQSVNGGPARQQTVDLAGDKVR